MTKSLSTSILPSYIAKYISLQLLLHVSLPFLSREADRLTLPLTIVTFFLSFSSQTCIQPTTRVDSVLFVCFWFTPLCPRLHQHQPHRQRNCTNNRHPTKESNAHINAVGTSRHKLDTTFWPCMPRGCLLPLPASFKTLVDSSILACCSWPFSSLYKDFGTAVFT